LLARKHYKASSGSSSGFSSRQNEIHIRASWLASIQPQLQRAVSMTCNSGRLHFNMRIKRLSPKRKRIRYSFRVSCIKARSY